MSFNVKHFRFLSKKFHHFLLIIDDLFVTRVLPWSIRDHCPIRCT